MTLTNELYHQYRWKMLALAALGIITGFLEGVGITLIIPLFTFFVGSADTTGNTIIRAINVFFERFNLHLGFQNLLMLTIAVFLIKAVLLLLFGYIRVRIVANYKKEIRNEMFFGFLMSDFTYLHRQKIGHLDAIILHSVKSSARLFEYIISLILSVANLTMFLVVAFTLSPNITLITIAVGSLLLFLYKPLIKKIRLYSHQLAVLVRSVSHTLGETLYGIKTIKALGVEKKVFDSTKHFFSDIEDAEFKKNIVKSFSKISIEPLSVVFIVGVFAVSYMYAEFNIITFVAIFYLIHNMFSQIEKMQSGLHAISETMPNAFEVVKILRDTKKYRQIDTGKSGFLFNNTIEFSHINFSYASQTLSDININIKKGEIVGIIGPSGAGKTTIVDLLLRLLEPTSGQILIDGNDIRTISMASWRTSIAYVAQDIFLRNDTILNNIRFYDDLVTVEDAKKAAAAANILEFIESLSNKFDTVIGERGSRLSGGERQRIALARAIVRRPKILILDEATSALDNEAEVQIREAVTKLKGRITIIIIAHRLSSVTNVDKLLVLDKGAIIEQGAPTELFNDPNSYFHKMSKLGNITLES
ncbi:MAG: ABC transporter ATP-binding protein [bacterium]|nr:ABC transporter ATP-binding protein [bacterium]